MNSRQQIKATGKQYFKGNYWNCVLAALSVTIIMGVINSLGNLGASGDIAEGTYSPGPLNGIAGLISLIVSGPLTIGVAYFFIQNIYGNPKISATTPVESCQDGFARKVAGYLWMSLFTFLWTLLLIIPGIIKALSYSMTTYILADCPNVQPKDALKLSMRMMDGHKMDLFMFFLSFIGWGLLTIFTLGLVGIFYAGPYMNSSSAYWYLECRDDALRRGAITMGQLQGIEPVL